MLDFLIFLGGRGALTSCLLDAEIVQQPLVRVNEHFNEKNSTR